MNNRNQVQAFWLAVIIESVLLAGAAFALTSTASMKPALSGSQVISLVNEDQQPAKPPEPKPKPQPKIQSKPQPQVVHEEPKPVLPQVTEAQATAFTEPAPPPPEAVAGKAEPSAEYAAKVHAAVQAAHYYPRPRPACIIPARCGLSSICATRHPVEFDCWLPAALA